jgi:hypothetical protein
MTAKEKANELVDKFYQTTPNEAWINEPLGISEEYKAWNQAKQCALILVTELIKENLRYDYIPFEGSRTEFYLKVEKEIQNL